MNFAKVVDHTNIRPEATAKDIKKSLHSLSLRSGAPEHIKRYVLRSLRSAPQNLRFLTLASLAVFPPRENTQFSRPLSAFLFLCKIIFNYGCR
jgi:deoxyribose-phosphate aldolase